MIKSNRQKIRRVYAPLTVMTSVKCTTPLSPVTQVFDTLAANGSEHTPDRSLFPTVIQPEISASAIDGTWPNGNANARLANVRWFSNGSDISLDPDWNGLYSIHTSDDDLKGTIEISRNIGVGVVCQLHMEADLIDYRTMRTVEIVTDAVTLSTTARTEDSYSIDCGDDRILRYSPTEDSLSLDDYNRAHGLKSLSASERAAAVADRNSYIRSLPLKLKRGAVETMEVPNFRYLVYRIAADGTLRELGGGFDEIVEIPEIGGSLRIDMRLIAKECYLVKAMTGERELARMQFQAVREQKDLNLEIHNNAPMSCRDRIRMDVATAKCGERVVSQPDRLMRMKWYTQTSTAPAVAHNSGSIGRIDLVRAGVISEDNEVTDDLSIWCEGTLKLPYRFVKANGKYVKANGRPVIMN